MCYLSATKNEILKISIDDSNEIRWWVDASYAVHPDMRSHTGAVMSMGKGAMQSRSTKQKINTRSSTESELVAVDDTIGIILWTQNLLKSKAIQLSVVYYTKTTKVQYYLKRTEGQAQERDCIIWILNISILLIKLIKRKYK